MLTELVAIATVAAVLLLPVEELFTFKVNDFYKGFVYTHTYILKQNL